ncbi:MAG: site-specific integrase, partial [Dolichospermum sp.]
MQKFSVYHAKYTFLKESFCILRSNGVIARSFPYNITISVLCRLAYSVMNPPPPPQLLEVVRETIRLKHYSYRTEQTYLDWIKRYLLFHQEKHPREMGKEEIKSFLSHLAVDKNVAAA